VPARYRLALPNEPKHNHATQPDSRRGAGEILQNHADAISALRQCSIDGNTAHLQNPERMPPTRRLQGNRHTAHSEQPTPYESMKRTTPAKMWHIRLDLQHLCLQAGFGQSRARVSHKSLYSWARFDTNFSIWRTQIVRLHRR